MMFFLKFRQVHFTISCQPIHCCCIKTSDHCLQAVGCCYYTSCCSCGLDTWQLQNYWGHNQHGDGCWMLLGPILPPVPGTAHWSIPLCPTRSCHQVQTWQILHCIRFLFSKGRRLPPSTEHRDWCWWLHLQMGVLLKNTAMGPDVYTGIKVN